MKKALLTFGQFLLFLVVFAAGSFLHPLHMHHWAQKSSPMTMTTTYFIPDGLMMAVGLLIAILVVQALRRRTCDTPWTILAFVLAILAGYSIRLGFITTGY
jgi:uncharacterized protein YacL